MDEPWRYVKWNKPVKKKIDIVWFHLNEVPRVVRFTETESRMMLFGGYTENGVSKVPPAQKDLKVLKMHGSNGCTAVNVQRCQCSAEHTLKKRW